VLSIFSGRRFAKRLDVLHARSSCVGLNEHPTVSTRCRRVESRDVVAVWAGAMALMTGTATRKMRKRQRTLQRPGDRQHGPA
jgi:hypothetical protein